MLDHRIAGLPEPRTESNGFVARWPRVRRCPYFADLMPLSVLKQTSRVSVRNSSI